MVKSSDGLEHEFYPTGFHGDEHLIALADHLVTEGGAVTFVETGCGVGSTTCHMARRYPGLRVYACDNDPVLMKAARKNATDYRNVSLEFTDSLDFLYSLGLWEFQQPTLYWLDAHNPNGTWPLPGEIACLTESEECKRAYLLIDDILVPGRPQFQYNVYGKIEASLENLKLFGYFAPDRTYQAFYPTYDRHSGYHPLVGTALVSFGAPLGNLSQFGFEEVAW